MQLLQDLADPRGVSPRCSVIASGALWVVLLWHSAFSLSVCGLRQWRIRHFRGRARWLVLHVQGLQAVRFRESSDATYLEGDCRIKRKSHGVSGYMKMTKNQIKTHKKQRRCEHVNQARSENQQKQKERSKIEDEATGP